MNLKCTCTTTRKANRAIFRFYEDVMSESPVTVTQFAILRSLERNGEMQLSELAREQVMERTSLYRTLSPLEDMKAVKIKAATKGKAKIATLTSKGRKLLSQSEPYWREAQDSVVELIGREKWEALQTDLLAIPELLAGYQRTKR